MPGAHTHIYTDITTYNFTLTMAQDHGLSRKKVTSQKCEPAHGPPLQAHVAAANRTVLQLANVLILAHMEMNRGQSKMNRTGAGT